MVDAKECVLTEECTEELKDENNKKTNSYMTV